MADSRSLPKEFLAPIEPLRKGNLMWKIRGPRKWFRRRYHVVPENMTLVYDPSMKLFASDSSRRLPLASISEIRKGWKTDVFNKLISEQRVPEDDERRCFSIMYKNNAKSLDLMATNEQIRDAWVRGLQLIVDQAKGLSREDTYLKWLENQFFAADKNESESLSFDEVLALLKNMNIELDKRQAKKLFMDANLNKSKVENGNVLDSDEFIAFFRLLESNRLEVEEVFKKYTREVGDQELTTKSLGEFFANEQGIDLIEEQAKSLVAAYEKSGLGDRGLLSKNGFRLLLLSDEMSIFSKDHASVHHDMSQPLSHYFISSSHNTYLTSHQLAGASSVEGYIYALRQGCRCVELDCWDGSDGEPIIYHGHTLTTRILFKDVIQDAIKLYAFAVTPYPLILSLEVHCSAEQQTKMAQYLKKILGAQLYCEPVDENMAMLPSPADLMNKIVVKAKKSTAEGSAEELYDVDRPDFATNDENGDYAVVTENLSTKLSDLVNLCQAVKFQGFQKPGKPFQMSSFSESKADDFIANNMADFVEYNRRQLSRIYPGALRTDSSNFNPVSYWSAGCQIVALNFQTEGKPMLLNRGKFRDNGGCGYVLKPSYMRKKGYSPGDEFRRSSESAGWRTGGAGPAGKCLLKLRIISGHCLPRPDGSMKGEVVDPYVNVHVVGVEEDLKKVQTQVVRNNGFNPLWNEVFEFVIKVPDQALLVFLVKDESTSGKNQLIGSYAVPLMAVGKVGMGSLGGTEQNLKVVPHSVQDYEGREKPFNPPVYLQRYSAVLNIIKQCSRPGPLKVVDFGSAEMSFVEYVKSIQNVGEILCVDMDRQLLKDMKSQAAPNYTDDYSSRAQPLRTRVMCGSVVDWDESLRDVDVVTAIELIEHLHEDALEKFPSAVFGKVRPWLCVISTPNSDFNVLFRDFKGFRHWDHKFEWSREEFQMWCNQCCENFGYTCTFTGVGDPTRLDGNLESHGYCSQIATFKRSESGYPATCSIPDAENNYELIAEYFFAARQKTVEEQLVDAIVDSARNIAMGYPLYDENVTLYVHISKAVKHLRCPQNIRAATESYDLQNLLESHEVKIVSDPPSKAHVISSFFAPKCYGDFYIAVSKPSSVEDVHEPTSPIPQSADDGVETDSRTPPANEESCGSGGTNETPSGWSSPVSCTTCAPFAGTTFMSDLGLPNFPPPYRPQMFMPFYQQFYPDLSLRYPVPGYNPLLMNGQPLFQPTVHLVPKFGACDGRYLKPSHVILVPMQAVNKYPFGGAPPSNFKRKFRGNYSK
ncbi:unnamed protein product [Notodromas monacha]|uniref:Phosphoinositide phospholipase C n=1 Tax=Notodromas monacha TaxID=399045 RepID=A0A7R9BIR6_9CRUS|nr:unnamed protein product [Notodromas monacha]CAG0914868.1 unnamed protein product [Notodromas monacha]